MKKLIITLLTTGILLLSTSSVNAWWDITHVPTDVGVVPVENCFGFVIHQDTFYHNYTK